MSRVLGVAIKNDRERLGISQSLLSRVLRVSQQIMSRWESGDAVPRGAKLDALLQTLGSVSETRRLVEQIRDIDPTFFDSPNHLAAFASDPLQGRVAPLSDSQINMLAAKGMLAYGRNAPEQAPAVTIKSAPEPVAPTSPSTLANDIADLNDDLRLQFARATDQIVRATNLLGKVAAMMAESGAILANVGQRIEALEQRQSKPDDGQKGE
jgi:transcriptional regulator with XRE-family HTH domain